MLLQLREWLPDVGAFGLSYGVEMRPVLAAWVRGNDRQGSFGGNPAPLPSALISGAGDYFTGRYWTRMLVEPPARAAHGRAASHRHRTGIAPASRRRVKRTPTRCQWSRCGGKSRLATPVRPS